MSEAREQEFSAERVPKSVVGRLSLYLREVQRLIDSGNETVNSTRLGSLLGITDAQVRKDFAYFGQFGHPGIGYRCEELAAEIRRILGTDQSWGLVLIGCGNLGAALLGYRGFHRTGFEIRAAVDVDRAVVGRTVNGVEIRPMGELSVLVARHGIRLAILAVPAESAQEAAEAAVAAGVAGMLNFAPRRLVVPDRVRVIAVDLANELEQLTFAVVTAIGRD